MRASAPPAGCSTWWARQADSGRASRRAAAGKMRTPDGGADDGAIGAWPAGACAAAVVAGPIRRPERDRHSGRLARWHLIENK